MTESIAEKRSIKDRLEQALVQHRAGQLRNAEALYQGILNEAPEHPDALHLLGLIRGEQGQEQIGIELIERALRKRPLAAAYHHNIAGLYRRVGDMALASALSRCFYAEAGLWGSLPRLCRDGHLCASGPVSQCG